MPQMSPILWLYLFFIFTFIFMLFNMLIYFNFLYKSYKTKKNNSLKKTFLIIWKW